VRQREGPKDDEGHHIENVLPYEDNSDFSRHPGPCQSSESVHARVECHQDEGHQLNCTYNTIKYVIVC
jgi:hypothetical protein